MKPNRILRLALFIIPLILLLFLTSITFGQEDKGSSDPMAKSPQVEAYDRKALEKLKKMSPEEIEALDKKLAQALTLFYDREYARALPIFKEISDKVETMDVAFWFASCAAKAGETDLAIKKFKQMLEIDPNLHRVRLELATVYFGIRKYEEARQELETVMAAKPPEAVKKNIHKLLAKIEAKTKRLFTNIRVSLGIQSDRNVSAGPDKQYINIPPAGTGGTITLDEFGRALRAWVGVINMAGNALYDMGKERAWMWNTTGSLYNTHTLEYEQFDFTQWRVTTGPWWVGRRSVLKIPVGYAQNLYEHEKLFNTEEFSPSYEYFFTPNISLRGMISFTKDQYIPTGRDGQDNTNRIFELNPSFYFNNRKDILSFTFSDEMLKAKTRRFSYDASNFAISYFKQFNWFKTWDMEFYARYKYSKREYQDPALLWPTNYLRTDKRHNFYMVLSRNFSRNCFASLSYNWINNQSNTELYDFEKYVYAFNIGFKF